MFPILYDETAIQYGSVPQDFGLGVLSDSLSCKISEERNGAFELVLTYPSTGKHANDLQKRRIIKAKPNFTDPPQLYRIYKINKKLKSYYTINARHISYDLSGASISSGTAGTCATACQLLSTQYFTIDTDKNVSATFKITEPSSRRSWLGGKAGSLLDVYGTGEYHYDNFNIHFNLHRGSDRGVEVRYGKNLLSLTQDLDASNLTTHIICYWKNADTGVVVESIKTATGLSLDIEQTQCIDVTNSFTEEPTVAQLNAKAQAMINQNDYTSLKNNIKLNFLQIKTLKDRVDLCDEVTIYYEDYNINVKAKCIKTTWDVLLDRYDSIELGDVKSSFASTFVNTMNALTLAQETADSKVSPTNIRTAWAVDDTSIYVQSGQIHFRAGTFLVDSNNLTIDAYGNVRSSSFKSNTSIEFYTTDWTHLLMKLGVYNGVQLMSFFGPTGNSSIVNIQADSNGGAVTVGDYSNNFASMNPNLILLSHNSTTPIKLNGIDGSITCVSLTQTSTRKAKKNIKNLSDIEAKKLLDLNPVKYDFKNEEHGKNRVGFIAEDVEVIIPEIVSKDEKGEANGIDYIELIPYITKLMQNQQKEIDKIKEKIV